MSKILVVTAAIDPKLKAALEASHRSYDVVPPIQNNAMRAMLVDFDGAAVVVDVRGMPLDSALSLLGEVHGMRVGRDFQLIVELGRGPVATGHVQHLANTTLLEADMPARFETVVNKLL